MKSITKTQYKKRVYLLDIPSFQGIKHLQPPYLYTEEEDKELLKILTNYQYNGRNKKTFI